MIELTHPLILASGSPRRKELLEASGFDITVQKFDFEETYSQELPPQEVPLFLSSSKARQIPSPTSNTIYLTADTVVVSNDGHILGKPKDKKEALEMILSYSNSAHNVITGCCLMINNFTHVFSDTTMVHFGEISKESAQYYINHYAPFDKAGAYGIQEWIGHTHIQKIEGNINTVIGLPTEKLLRELKQLNLINPDNSLE